MSWWIWLVVIATAAFLIVDWFIVMGVNPKKWKGDDADDRDSGPDR